MKKTLCFFAAEAVLSTRKKACHNFSLQNVSSHIWICIYGRTRVYFDADVCPKEAACFEYIHKTSVYCFDAGVDLL